MRLILLCYVQSTSMSGFVSWLMYLCMWIWNNIWVLWIFCVYVYCIVSLCVCVREVYKDEILYIQARKWKVSWVVCCYLCFLYCFFLELFLEFDWGWCLVFSTFLFFLVFPSLIVSWVFFVLFNIIYVCFDKSCAVRVHDEWFFTHSICFYKYVQATARGEEGMMLFFVCCNPNYGHRWRDWEFKFWW